MTLTRMSVLLQAWAASSGAASGAARWLLPPLQRRLRTQ